MKSYVGVLIWACLGGLTAMIFTVIFIGLMVDDLDPSKTNIGLAWAVYSCVWGPIAGVFGCVLGGLIYWRNARSSATHDDHRPVKYLTCPDCAAGGIIPTKNGECTNCGCILPR